MSVSDHMLLERLAEAEELIQSVQAALMERVAGPTDETPRMAWGARVSEAFRDRVSWICRDPTEGLFPYAGAEDDLMSCIAWETGRTFSASVKNMAGSGATGLIQFMPKTAAGLGTSTSALAAMTAEDQLRYVYKYFSQWKPGTMRSLSDMYMAILWPAAVGKGDDYVLFDRRAGPTAYRQNAGLDADKDGDVTKAEAAAKLYAMRAEGLRPENVA